MPKIKYYYDTETCRYERVTVSTADIVLNLLGFITIILICGVLMGFAFYEIFPSPKEETLRKENEELRYAFELQSKKVDNLEAWLAELEDKDDNIYRSIFGADPIPESIRKRGIGGRNIGEEYLENTPNITELTIPLEKKIARLTQRMYTQTRSYDKLAELARQKEQMLASLPAIQPVANKNLRRFASGFGYRPDPFTKVRRFHKGCDFSAPVGTPIFATGDGVVIESGWGGGYGKRVYIDHGFGYETRYAHMSNILVRKGQKVKRGELIGKVGNTGRSRGAHLHYEVRYKGQPVNPTNYFFNDLTDEQYEEIIRMNAQENESLGSGYGDEER